MSGESVDAVLEEGQAVFRYETAMSLLRSAVRLSRAVQHIEAVLAAAEDTDATRPRHGFDALRDVLAILTAEDPS